jgi:hypothetical protein
MLFIIYGWLLILNSLKDGDIPIKEDYIFIWALLISDLLNIFIWITLYNIWFA